MKKKIINILIVILALIFICSGVFIGVNLYMYHRQQQTFDELISEFPEEETPPVIEWIEVPPVEVPEMSPVTEDPEDFDDISDGDETAAVSRTDALIRISELSKRPNMLLTTSGTSESTTEENPDAVYAPSTTEIWCKWWNDGFADRLPVYISTAARNLDVVGWVRIVGTTLDYPVCQTPSDPEKYIHMDIDGKYSSYGTPFMDAVCRLTKPRSNLVIYGHHMRNSAMFAVLQNYTSISYYRQHPFIQFDTTVEPGTYQVALVLRVDAEGILFPWQDLLFPENEEVFNSALVMAILNRFYDTGVPITYTDELLALVTCEYTVNNGRLMVIAKRVS